MFDVLSRYALSIADILSGFAIALVFDKWKNTYYTSACGDDSIYYNQTAFAYIQAHMGYRFVLKESVFEYSQKFDALNVKLTLDNVGFGNLNKTKLAKLVFVDESGQIAQVKQVSKFSGQLNLDYSVDLNQISVVVYTQSISRIVFLDFIIVYVSNIDLQKIINHFRRSGKNRNV